MINSLNIMIKPSSSNCNMRCEYCFYHSISEKRLHKSWGFMNFELLETIVRKALNEVEDACTFAFQGGEPTLAGLDFYKKLVKCEQKYNQKNIEINNAIQTNGLTIDEEWAHFLAQNHFLVGISLDGPKKIHDLYRIDNQGKGTFQRIIKAINLFDQYHVKYNILTVVTAQVARDIHKIYNFFKDKNFKYLQFIPCLDPLQEEPGVYRFSLTPEKYSYFLKTLFDLWYEDVMSDHLVNIRYFDNLLQLLMGYPPEACGTLGKCNCQFIIEANGGVYPCDFYVVDKWYLGNIKEKSFLELLTSPNSYQFVEMSQNFDSKCNNCPWFFVCRGGCRRWCEPFNDGKPSINILCSAYQDFFQYTLEQFRNIVEKIRRGDFNN
ncbi:Anaerobic sulfatase-maturating enzyme [subsurface metagenome]